MHKSVVKSKVFHFADDTNLLYANKDPKQIMKTMKDKAKQRKISEN